MTLSDLKRGETGIIGTGGGSSALTLRLMELGLTPGTAVDVLRWGPGGESLLIRLRGYTLTVTRTEARQIPVQRKGAM